MFAAYYLNFKSIDTLISTFIFDIYLHPCYLQKNSRKKDSNSERSTKNEDKAQLYNYANIHAHKYSKAILFTNNTLSR